ncbi:MAG: Holliday junction branch migration protein RuvA [Lachnospiraceae bacterium]|nr:Holliday junction branch migration protein RuvA [Lachnospiraceae bacterium]MDD3660506.1 Holliday junction branch migration protein RuvA [Lachnospiraceae bacterium]
MIAFLKGEIAEICDDIVVIDVRGVGYNVRVPLSVTGQLPGIGQTIKIHTYTLVREDAFLLYGFLNRDDLAIFKKLILVNGIGPKGALSILSSMSADTLRFAIYSGDAKTIAKAPGIGAKTAERLILDLKDKITISDSLVTPESNSNLTDGQNWKDAIEAMVSLGYSASEALTAIRSSGVAQDDKTENILKKALLMM